MSVRSGAWPSTTDETPPHSHPARSASRNLLHMVKNEKLSYSSMNQAACAAQFLFQTVLGHDRKQFHVQFAKAPVQQPELLARGEISRLLAACWRPDRRALLTNRRRLRAARVRSLRPSVSDIDSAPDRMCVRVACRQRRQGALQRAQPHTAPGAARLRGANAPQRLALYQRQRQRPHGRDHGAAGLSRCLRSAPASPRAAASTPCATALPPICWRAAWTCSPSRSCWATATSAPPGVTCI